MRHAKNIFKSLLITVLALSLFAVSCKKDGGGSPPPTGPITITASAINNALTFTDKAVGSVATITTKDAKVATTTDIAIDAKSTGNNISKTDFKTGMETIISSISINGATVAKSEAADGDFTVPSSQTAMTVKLVITPTGSNTFESSLTTTGGTAESGTLTVTLRITPSANWS